MLTYQVRERLFRPLEDRAFSFPNSAEMVFFLKPLQPFGKSSTKPKPRYFITRPIVWAIEKIYKLCAINLTRTSQSWTTGGRTAVGKWSAYIDANTGHYSIESKKPLDPLHVVIEEPIRKVELIGNELRITEQVVQTSEQLERLILSIYFAFPILLNIEFADPPTVERVEGKVGGVPFRWELKKWNIRARNTTEELQAKRVFLSWSRFDVVSKEDRRLLAALHYFHVACRLVRAGNSPWEFMSEAILNYSKVLEMLFGSRDAARKGLESLGYKKDKIEKFFIPAMALRSYIDSAHGSLSMFTRTQLRVLHDYADAAELEFRTMLSELMNKMEKGEFALLPYTDPVPKKKAIAIIDKLSKHEWGS